jgi:hypothetical protein
MLTAIQFEPTEPGKPTQLEEQFPMQEKIANPATFRVERSMTEILIERLLKLALCWQHQYLSHRPGGGS